uniref:Tripartite motif containing 35-13 n=1 Tax=Esox lucius TaxID=8010 RepID=A0AAY5KME2_ESOLU
ISSFPVEELLCPVCNKIFKNPVLLNCSHNICKSCWEKFCKENKSWECPVCRRSSSMNPPFNLALNRLCEVSASEIQESQGASAGSEVFCSLHREKLKLFCLTDKQPICVLCRDSNKHKSHDCVPIDEAVPDLKNELQTVLKPFNAKLEVFKKVKQTLDQTAEHINNQVKHTEQKINQDFEEIYHFLQNEKAARIAALRREEEQKSKMMKEKIEEMSTNISSLSDTIRAIEKELKAEDIPFLQNFKATKKRSQCSLPDPQLVSGSLIDVAEHLGNLQFRVWEKMRGIVKYTPVILDPNTAHPSLYLSEDLTSVRRPGTWQLLPDNPERFMKYPDVLGIEGFSSGNHSWQVEVGAHPQWFLGVATENKDRNGTLGVSPKDGIWCIILDCGKYRAGGGMGITLKRRPQEIRVALDYERGEVSFHDPKDMTLIYTHKDRFTEKLFPYLNIGRASLSVQTQLMESCPKSNAVF